jgi:hypothetical protein
MGPKMQATHVTGTLKKMRASLTEPINYQLPVGNEEVELNALIGKPITINFSGNIFCSSCGKKNQKKLLARALFYLYAQAR